MDDSDQWADGLRSRVRAVLTRYEDGNQGAMARTLGITRQAVSAWMRGRSVPSAEMLAALVEAYELDARWLLIGELSEEER